MELVLLGIILFGVLYYLASLSAIYVKLTFHLREPISKENIDSSFLPPISILKPVKNSDPNLYANLVSFATQDYPRFELLFGVHSETDPAMQIVQRLVAEYPAADITVVTEAQNLGYNPKVNNLAGIYELAKYEHLVISDSNVRVAPDYLRRNVQLLREEKVGLVNNLFRGVQANTMGALFENLHLNSFILGSMSLMDLLFNAQLVTGKSLFFRKTQFQQLGGLRQLRNYLAEDYLMAKLYRQAGYQVVLSSYLVDNVNHGWGFKKFLNRHTRWGRVRFKLHPPAYLGELLINFSFWALVLSAVQGMAGRNLLLPLSVWGVKIIGDFLINRRLGSPLRWFSSFLSPIKDLIIAVLWVCPLISSKTKWRGLTLKITKDTLLVPFHS